MRVELMPCPACGRPVSSRARECIHCGDPLTVAPASRAAHPVPTAGRPRSNDLAPSDIAGWIQDTVVRVTIVQGLLAALALYMMVDAFRGIANSDAGLGSLARLVVLLVASYFYAQWV